MADNQKQGEDEKGVWDTLLADVRLATMAEPGGYGIIEPAAIGMKDGRITWIGPMDTLPGAVETLAGDIIECSGQWVTPGLIDCHTHIIYAGHYPQTLEVTVQAIRAATEDQLLEAAGKRLVTLLEEGVTTVGIQSGYGLDRDTENKLQTVTGMLGEIFPMHLLTRFNGEKTLPEPHAGSNDAFNEEGVRALASAAQVAVLLPGVFYTRGMTQKPLVDDLRKQRVPMILSTGCNPVSSPCTSLLLVMNMACHLFGLSPLEALQGVTSHVAKALGISADIGTIEVGKMADIALWDIVHPDELSCQLGYNPCLGIMKGGVLRRVRE